MHLILVRHGETELNVARTVQPADTPLSDTGRRQARALADRLASAAPAAIVSSDLPRARATAEAIAAATGLGIDETALLRERSFGDWRGHAYAALGFDPLATHLPPPNGETLAEFQARVALAFADLLRRSQGLSGPLVVVTHGLVIHAILQNHLALSPGHALPERLGNTSVTVCAAAHPHGTERVNCLAHLAALEATPADAGGAV